LLEAPLIQLLKNDNRKPYPITLEQQALLLAELPDYLQAMVLFALNTGCRESEITGLKWCEEDRSLSIFIIPSERTKNGEDRIVPLNTIAKKIIGVQRDNHTDFVFAYIR
jgi:integrase